jgi:hypothetical protein
LKERDHRTVGAVEYADGSLMMMEETFPDAEHFSWRVV